MIYYPQKGGDPARPSIRRYTVNGIIAACIVYPVTVSIVSEGQEEIWL